MKRRVFILWLSSVFITFLVAVCLIAYALLRLLPTYQSSIESVLSSVTGSKVSLQIEYTGWYGIDPVIKVSQIKIKGQNFSLNIPQMVIHVNALASLNDWKFVTQSVLVEKPVLAIYPNKKGLDYQFLQSLSVNEIDEIGGRWSNLLVYLLQQNQLVLDDMQVLVSSYDNKALWHTSVNARYHQSNSDKGVLRLTIQPQTQRVKQGVITLLSTIQKKGDTYYFDSVLNDQENLLSDLLDKVKLKSLVDNQLSFSIESTINKLNSVSVMGELSQVELKTDLLKESIFNNVVFNLRLFRYQDKFILGANPLSFIAQHKRYTFRSALFFLDQHRLIMNVPRLNLADFSNLMQLESSSWRKNIILTGALSDVRFVFDLQEPDLDGVQLIANFNNLGIAQSDHNIDFKGLTGKVWWQQNHMKMSLDSPDFQMAKNHVFSKEWPKLSLKAELGITRTLTNINFAVDNLLLENNNIRFSAKGNVNVPFSNPIDFVLDISGKLQGHDLTTEYQSFLPKEGIPLPLYEWLMKCLYGAESLDAMVEIKGIAHEIPYPGNNGTFKIDANINNGRLSPYFGLGVAQKVNGSLHFNNEQLQAAVTEGFLGNIPISGLTLSIDNIAPHVPASLNIRAEAKTNSQNVYDYLTQTDYKKLVEKINHIVTYEGDLGVQLGVKIPLGDHSKKDEISGVVTIKGGILELKKPMIKSLYDVNAEIAFANQHFMIRQFSSMWNVNSPITLKGTVDVENQDNPRLDLQGGMVLPLKSKVFSSLPARFTDTLMQGVLPVSFTLQGGVKKGVAEIKSNFLGASSIFGEPLNKRGFELMPLSFKSIWHQVSMQEKQGSDNHQHVSLLSLWHIDSKLDFNHETKVTAGFNIDSNAAIDSLNIYGDIQKLSSQFILNWMNVVNTHQLLEPLGKEWQQFVQLELPLLNESKNTAGCFVQSNYYDCVYRNLNRVLKPEVAVTIHEFDAFGTLYHKLNLKTETADDYTNLIAQADQNQSVVISVPNSLGQPIEINAKNLFFSLNAQNQAKNSEDLFARLNVLLQGEVLRKVPDMNVKFTHLQLGGYSIPNLLMAIKLREGILSIPVLSAYDSNSKLLAELMLSPIGSHLQLNISSLDWGRMLNNFGYNDVLKGGSGNLKIRLNWPTLVPQLKHISGTATIDLFNGVILSVDSGVAKYIGLLSLDSYFKRLFMPYDDFEHRGMPFNTLAGVYKLENAMATSSPSVIIDTPSFALVIDGNINLLNKQLSQRIKYQPHFSATTAAVAGAFGGPVVAFATYLGGKFLGNTLFKNMGLLSFDVTGSWNKPILKQVQ